MNSRQRRKREAERHNKALNTPKPKRMRGNSSKMAMLLAFALSENTQPRIDKKVK